MPLQFVFWYIFFGFIYIKKFLLVPEYTHRTQRGVEIYLEDLKERLNQLRMQNDAVIHNSEEIINELDEVSSTLVLTENCGSGQGNERLTKIKKLILEFEKSNDECSAKTTVVPETHVNLKQILENFEKLTGSQLLKDSLLLFRRAKESLEKIDTLLDNGQENHNNCKKCNISEGIRQQVCLFSQNKKQLLIDINSGSSRNAIESDNSNAAQAPTTTMGTCELAPLPVSDSMEPISNYVSCCSSIESLQQYPNRLQNVRMGENSFSGYECD